MKKFNLLILMLFTLETFGQNIPLTETGLMFPTAVNCKPQPYYRFRPDGKPGREITLDFNGGKLSGKVLVEVTADKLTESTELSFPTSGQSDVPILLPASVGLKKESQVLVTIRQGKNSLKKSFVVPVMRNWTVYIYPHSHVDIGYTNTQANVEILHKRNIEEGIRLAQATKGNPEGSRYRWNPEITWPLERYWQTANREQKDRVVQAIREGSLCIDGSYLNLNTSSCSGEELFQVLRFSREMQNLTGIQIKTYQQMDIPGISWGLVPVMAQQGVRYIMMWPNGCRAGNGHGVDEKPFWWLGPDGKSKVLFFQPGSYGNSGSMSKGGTTGRPWFGQFLW